MKEFIARVWEGIISNGPQVAERYSGIPATARFSFSSPSLRPRVRKLGPIRPFTFLTERYLEPSSDPNADRSELVAFISPSDELRRSKLMDQPRQWSWGSALESFIRHRDRKCSSDAVGRMVRRHVLVRRNRIVPLGEEANRIEAGRILGLSAVGGRAKRYVDVKGRLLAMGRAEARALGISWATVTRWKRRVRSGLPLTNGHGGQALDRFQFVVLSAGRASPR
jgi:hypothetical protein